ncbi:MAG: UDP-N-acetylmuramoyl-tripeptide--D-alanyl-D-alanine ligase [Candidatus Pacebacteria bacterium]|nr:UDP-N-acetylmuramoyl-tripeptide--D-alanyl-D-alanine ligase [Candidatus Paceibacterota bacterium]
MNQIFLKCLFCFFFMLVNLENLSRWLFWWQTKEYRFDRMRVHLKTPKGRKGLFGFFYILKLFFVIGPGRLSGFYFFLFALESFSLFLRFLKRSLKKPKFTFKIWLLLGESLFFQGSLIFFLCPCPTLSLTVRPFFTANLLLPAIVALGVAVLAIPTLLIKKRIIKKARRKIKKQPNLTVIGITGSFGKTSTKEFLKVILESQFRVLATTDHENTLIGVARQINRYLTDKHQFYIVEMGAYKKGEIKAICDLVTPKMAIITGIGFQHLSLFGSPENLIEAKNELIESLPADGLAFFNGDTSGSLLMSRRCRVKKKIFALDYPPADFRAKEIKISRKSLRFKISAAGFDRFQIFSAGLLGKQNISNLLSAIALGFSLKMNPLQIALAIKKQKPLTGTMKLVSGPGQINLIDDSYNSNPEGVLAALDYLGVFPKNKYLVFQPMIELGEKTEEEHRRVSKKALKICRLIFLTNQNFYRRFVNSRDRDRVFIVRSPRDFLKKILPYLRRDEAILFEGREADPYLKAFLREVRKK